MAEVTGSGPQGPHDWTIRRAVVRDADGLRDCLDAAYAEYAERIPDLPPVSANCAEEIDAHEVWVAESCGVIVGGLVLVPGDAVMLLANVAVHPDRRGAGLGRQLLALAEAEAAARGYGEMRLNTHADMPETVRLYARNGWEQVALRGNTITMKKRLRPPAAPSETAR